MTKKETFNKTSMNLGSGAFLKSAVMKKTAGLLVTMLLLSALMPVLAFAQLSFDTSSTYTNYVDNTVKARVYGDVNDSVYGSVYLSVYDSNWNFIKSVYLDTYTTGTVGGTTYKYYDFTTVLNSVYQSVYLKYSYNSSSVGDSVYNDVYVNRTTSNNDGPGTGTPGTGTPGTETPAPGGKDGVIEVGNEVAADALIKAFEGRTEVTIIVKGDKVAIPASALVEAAKKEGAKLIIKNANGTYELPLSVIDFEALAKELGVELKDLKITVTIKALTGDDAKPVTDAIAALGGSAIAAVVDFSVTAEGNGKSVEIKNFGNTYVSRSLNTNKAVDAKKATGVVYNPETQELTFVPATFKTEDGKTVATLKSTSNSIYTVVELDKSFADVEGDWSEKYVVPMVNKLIVEGYEDGSFGPDRTITRAEFATLVVRALGLSNRTATSDFSDVKADAWYANDVAVAAEVGLIKGFEDGTFRPTAEITREQLSALVVRASAFAGKDLSVAASEQASILAKFRDASDIGWAQAEIAAAVKAGIVQGLKADLLGSDNTATRAEAATMLYRFLLNAEFINE